MMEFDSIDKLHMHFAQELASWHITREEYDGIDEMLKAVEKDVSKRIKESEAFGKRVQKAVENHEDVTLFGIDYMPLPVDADGVPIHVGDVMDNTHKDGFRAKRVTGIAYHENGRTTIEVDEDRLRWHNADKLRHHHAPTVESVLAEMLDAWGELPSNVTNEAIVAEYAAKLRDIIEWSKGPEWQETASQDEGR